MKDDRTPEQKYQAWVNAVNKAHAKGWKCESQWIFKSPVGTYHDLSASYFDKLDYIEEHGISLV